MERLELFLSELFSNRLLLAALIGWAAAQLLKMLLHLVLYRQWRPERLWGSGGMPSSHSATVCALAVSALLGHGAASPVFALALVLAAVVLHDARGVRFETGKQARLLSAIADILEKTHKGVLPEVELKELVGHTPLQVIAGSLIGVLVGCLIHG